MEKAQELSDIVATICVRQIGRSDGYKAALVHREGYGDCRTCTPDAENNPRCRGYVAVKVQLYRVVEDGRDR